jgi:hypothetical protein
MKKEKKNNTKTIYTKERKIMVSKVIIDMVLKTKRKRKKE